MLAQLNVAADKFHFQSSGRSDCQLGQNLIKHDHKSPKFSFPVELRLQKARDLKLVRIRSQHLDAKNLYIAKDSLRLLILSVSILGPMNLTWSGLSLI